MKLGFHRQTAQMEKNASLIDFPLRPLAKNREVENKIESLSVVLSIAEVREAEAHGQIAKYSTENGQRHFLVHAFRNSSNQRVITQKNTLLFLFVSLFSCFPFTF